MQLVDSTFSCNFCVALDRLISMYLLFPFVKESQLQVLVCDDRFYCTVFMLSCLST